MKRNRFILIWVQLFAITLLIGFASNPLFAKNYLKILKGISIGMDSSEVISKAGSPTKAIGVERWYYENDAVIFIDENVVDIRIDHTQDTIKRFHGKNKQSLNKTIAALRIGMKQDEVSETSGLPNKKVVGTDLYFSNRHRVELTMGEVSLVETQIKKGMDILDWIRLNFTSGGLLIMNITIAFIMFGVALEIKLKHFNDVVLKPKSALVGVLSQFIALPALTFLLVLIINPTPSVALGMILVASCPGGNVSNFMSSVARANIELSVSLTALATLSAIFMTPLNFALWGSLYSGTANMIIPIKIDAIEMTKTVLILMGIPILLGVSFSYKFPNLTKKIIKPIKIFSILAFLGFIAAAFAANFKFFLDYIHFIILIVLAHNLLALLTGFSLATFFKLPQPDRRTLTIETGIQNSGLALVLIFNPNLFNGLGGMAFIAAWWGIWHIIAGLGIATIWSKIPLTSDVTK